MEQYIPKELSWLSFNARVLQEACDPTVPLVERVRFLGIYSNNQDEFFKVRVADLKRQTIISNERTDGSADAAARLLRQVQKCATDYQRLFNDAYRDIIKELAAHHVYLYDEKQVSDSQREWVGRYFKQEVLQHINPVIITETVDLVSFLKDQYTYLLVKMDRGEERDAHALIEIPTDAVPRFISLPSDAGNTTLMFLDDVIRLNLGTIFSGYFTYRSIEAYSIKMNRDAEYDLTGTMDKSLLENMSSSLKQRLIAMPVRFAYDKEMPEPLVMFIAQELRLSRTDSMMPGNRYHNFKDLLRFPGIDRESMEEERLPLIESEAFGHAATPFEAIARRDILLYYPYYSFRHFTEFLRQASYDPKVIAIKINIYRVARESLVINSLIDAANNGKSVTVVVELKARFDEANNIKWASRLTDAGVKVLFGLPTLKIHSKLCLITRHEGQGLVRYAHIGTGNFNESTAKVYTDFALFTVHPGLTQEVESVFNFIEYPYTRPTFRYLLVSPLNSRQRLYSMIDREILNAQSGLPAYIRLKVNNLVDPGLIDRLYSASREGVKVRAIVRGMCALRPGIGGLSENIYITSIVDHFLEHPRVMIFCNNNDPELYITSADWMTRNLDYRIEVGTQILDPRLRRRIWAIFRIQESDNCKARVVDDAQRNRYVQGRPGDGRVRSQYAIHDYLRKAEEREREEIEQGGEDEDWQALCPWEEEI
ncbi:MAG: polyphosphate kinase 1 [Succinivibrionaceae bacterium]|nr:polyphosphate kinase 1 [Succinivibrionaceae bacterium]